MKTPSNLHRAFTLVELLVVIAIIALLTGIIVSNIVNSRSKARDGKRISDLGQLQLAMNLYYDRCKQYPFETQAPANGLLYLTVDFNASNNCANGGKLSDYISQIPLPPNNAPLNEVQYDYVVNDNTNPQNYVLHTTLENPNEILGDSLTGTQIGGTYGIICHNPNGTDTEYCLGPK